MSESCVLCSFADVRRKEKSHQRRRFRCFLGKVQSPVSEARNLHFHPCLWFELAAAVCRPALLQSARQQQPRQVADPEEFTFGVFESAVVVQATVGYGARAGSGDLTFLT